MTLDDFIKKLEASAGGLTHELVEKELRDYMSIEELAGLEIKITGGIRKIVDSLRVRQNE